MSAPVKYQRARVGGTRGKRTKSDAPRAHRITLTFAQKLTIAMLLVLALSLSIGGAVFLMGNFNDQLDEAANAAEAQHLLQCYALEATMRDVAAQGETITREQLARFGSGLADYTRSRLSAALYWETPPEGESDLIFLYANWIRSPKHIEGAYVLHQEYDRYTTERDTYIIFETAVRAAGAPGVVLMTGYDVSNVFAARDRSLVRFWEMEIVVLLCAGVVIALLSKLLTKPLARLTTASESIAGGAYDMRTDIRSGDEIGALSRSFDTMAAAVEEKIAALELSVRQREDFMSAFTHELRTPMTAVIGYADTLRSMQCEPEEQRVAAGYIYSEATRVETLSEKLLELLGLGETPPQLKPVELDAVFAEAEKALTPALAPRYALDIRRAPNIFIYGDAALLTDLLYNLIQNAARAKPKDGLIHLDWNAKENESAVDVRVWDTGCGIPEELVARVTEPFFMVDKSRARAGGGSGVGLALCDKIARLHGGGLTIQSRLGEGTAVIFRLSTKPLEAGETLDEG